MPRIFMTYDELAKTFGGGPLFRHALARSNVDFPASRDQMW
jgi:hypothetical protein